MQTLFSFLFTRKAAIFCFIFLQACIALTIGLPGQLSVDSLVQLYEGRYGHSISWHPPFMSVLLGFFDRLGNASALFVLSMQALLSASIWLVLSADFRTSYVRLILAMYVLLNPVIAIYTGIVWKDVLLANSVVFLFLFIHYLQWTGRPVNIGRLILCFLLMTIIVGSRQQGILFLIPATIWLTILQPSRKAFKPIIFIIFLAIPILLSHSISNSLEQSSPVQSTSTNIGLRVIIRYNLVGIMVHDGELPKETSKQLVEELQQFKKQYDPTRQDTLLGPSGHFWSLTLKDGLSILGKSILANPLSYLSHRVEHFSALLGFGDMRLCFPLFSGINTFHHEAIDTELSEVLGLHNRVYPYAGYLYLFGKIFANSPLFYLWFYGLICIACSIILVKRQQYVLASLGITAILFLLSYFIISIACDFRYGYTLTLSSVILLAYCIVSPTKKDYVSHHFE